MIENAILVIHTINGDEVVRTSLTPDDAAAFVQLKNGEIVEGPCLQVLQDKWLAARQDRVHFIYDGDAILDNHLFLFTAVIDIKKALVLNKNAKNAIRRVLPIDISVKEAWFDWPKVTEGKARLSPDDLPESVHANIDPSSELYGYLDQDRFVIESYGEMKGDMLFNILKFDETRGILCELTMQNGLQLTMLASIFSRIITKDMMDDSAIKLPGARAEWVIYACTDEILRNLLDKIPDSFEVDLRSPLSFVPCLNRDTGTHMMFAVARMDFAPVYLNTRGKMSCKEFLHGLLDSRLIDHRS